MRKNLKKHKKHEKNFKNLIIFLNIGFLHSCHKKQSNVKVNLALTIGEVN